MCYSRCVAANKFASLWRKVMGKKTKELLLGLLLALLLLTWGCQEKEPEVETNKEATETPSHTPTPTEAAQNVSTARLKALVNMIEHQNLDKYANPEIMDEPLAAGKALLEKEDLTQSEVDAAVKAIEDAYAKLGDGSGFTAPENLRIQEELPDPFLRLDGTAVVSKEDWTARAEELGELYQYYMYGVWRDGSDEEVTYDYSGGVLTVHVKRISTGTEVAFRAAVQLPAASVEAPDGGYPVIVGMHAGISEATANAKGYATITLNTYEIASDDNLHKGVFYELYPYGSTWEEQSGVLMAWSWGCSKVLDALEAGAGAELNVSPVNTIVTGVSRWGKAAMVCGAFEKRFKMAAPSCSGAGGVALYRYMSEGKTYDFSSKGASSAYTYGQNEPLSSLQSAAEQGWFNRNFMKLSSPAQLPVDQHLLCSMAADEDRYLFIIGSCISEDWVNAPSMWYSYLAAQKVFDFLGLSDHLAINIHKEGHAVIAEDVEYMTDYFNYHVYGIEPEKDLDDLKTSVFALEQNRDAEWDSFADGWAVPQQ